MSGAPSPTPAGAPPSGARSAAPANDNKASQERVERVAKKICVRALHMAKELGLERVFRTLVDQSPETVLTFVRNRAVGRRALDESLTRAGLPPRETLKALLGNSRSVADAVALEYVLFLSRATDPQFSWLMRRLESTARHASHGLWVAPGVQSPGGSPLLRTLLRR